MNGISFYQKESYDRLSEDTNMTNFFHVYVSYIIHGLLVLGFDPRLDHTRIQFLNSNFSKSMYRFISIDFQESGSSH